MIPLRQPRRRPPSSKQLEIYAAVMVRGRRQIDVAQEFKITQPRVSQIITRVKQWRAQTDSPTQGELPEGHRCRHERWLAHERCEEIFQRSMRLLDASERTLTNSREGTRGDTKFSETTRREQAANVQWMKTALKAAEDLLKLAELKPLPEPEPQEDHRQQLAAVGDWLWDQRQAAEQAGRVAKSADIGCLVRNWLAVLLGNPPGLLSPGFVPPDAAVQELVRRFVRPRVPVIGLPPGAEELLADVLGPAGEAVAVGCMSAAKCTTPVAGASANIPNTPHPLPTPSTAPPAAPTLAATPYPTTPCDSPSPAYVSPNYVPLPEKNPADISSDRADHQRPSRAPRARRTKYSVPSTQYVSRTSRSPAPDTVISSPSPSPNPQPSARPPLLLVLDGAPCPPDPCDPLDLPERLHEHLRRLVPVVTER
jgi:hypothetical protein